MIGGRLRKNLKPIGAYGGNARPLILRQQKKIGPQIGGLADPGVELADQGGKPAGFVHGLKGLGGGLRFVKTLVNDGSAKSQRGKEAGKNHDKNR